MVTDVPRTKRLPMPMLTDVLGPQMFTDTDGYRCLWFTGAYAERMLMHKVWMTEIPSFRHEMPRSQGAQKPQSLNMRISSGRAYRPYICADADAFWCFGPQMLTDTDGYRCFGVVPTSDAITSTPRSPLLLPLSHPTSTPPTSIFCPSVTNLS